MNKRIDFSHLGGLPVTQQTLSYMQESYRSLFAALAFFIGDKVVVSGMQEIGGQCSDGWLSVAGELMPFQGGSLGSTVVIVETNESRLFFDGQSKPVYYNRVATFGAGSGSFPYADIKRIGTLKDMWYGMAPKGALMYYEGLVADLPAGWQIHELSKGRVLVGQKDDDPDFDEVGNFGGAKTKALSILEMPSHTHPVPIPSDKTSQSHDGNGKIVGGSGPNEPNPSNSLTATAVGGGQAFSIMNPYYVAAIIKKVI